MALKRYKQWVVFNDKFATRIHNMEARIDRIEKIDRPVLERRKMDLSLNGWRGSNQVLEFEGVSKVFTHLTSGLDTSRAASTGFVAKNAPHSPQRGGTTRPATLNELNFLIRHGERVGLVGANGAGKSVLLRLILGKENPTSGEIRIGPSVKIGHYAQEHETLDFDQSVLDTVRLGGNMSEGRAVSFLTRYLFTYRQATQKVGSLSGGERSRLQLALLVLSGANFLLLDEPTNNLDIASAEVLENALDDFNGTVLVISHDRYFLDRTVNRIFELKDARITEYVGGYSDYAENVVKNKENP